MQRDYKHYSLPLLPREIVEEEILPRLPVKSLLRFKCVSKSWRSLIESQWFVEKHHPNSKENTSLAHHRVIYDDRTDIETRQCSLQSILDQTSGHPSPFDEETDNKHVTDRAYVVGCCNGLICFSDYYTGHFFLNPATKEVFELPKPPVTEMPDILKWVPKRGFCWDETAGAYKVFALLFDPDLDERVAQVYSSKTNSWTTVEHGSISLYDNVGVHACGCLHWLAEEDDDHPCHIESFNLRSEKFGKIAMPRGVIDGFFVLRLGEVRGCIVLLCERPYWYADLWVMKEHGVEESWKKLVRLDGGNCFGGRRLFSAPSGERVIVCGQNFLVFSGGNATTKSKKISRGNGAGAVKSKKSSQGWFSGVKGLFRGFYEGFCSRFRGFDYSPFSMYFYVESLVSPFPPPLFSSS